MAALYVGAQFVGAFAAALIWFVLQGRAGLSFGASHPGIQFSSVTAAGAETVLTFALVLVILMTAQEEASVGKQAALAVGFMVAACGFVGGPISGASMNPARTIAPQIVSGHFENIWIYLAGPVIGALLAVGAHALICGKPSRGERKAARGKLPRCPAGRLASLLLEFFMRVVYELVGLLTRALPFKCYLFSFLFGVLD